MTVEDTVKIWGGNMSSQDELERYSWATYTADGDESPSQFMIDWRISEYEPEFWEIFREEAKRPIRELLKGVSYWESFEKYLPEEHIFNSAILIYHTLSEFALSALQSPMKFIGEFKYRS
jgi:hypothetical protein